MPVRSNQETIMLEVLSEGPGNEDKVPCLPSPPPPPKKNQQTEHTKVKIYRTEFWLKLEKGEMDALL